MRGKYANNREKENIAVVPSVSPLKEGFEVIE